MKQMFECAFCKTITLNFKRWTYSAEHNLICCTSCYHKEDKPKRKELILAYGYIQTYQAHGNQEVF